MTLREVMHAHVPTLTTNSTVRDAIDKMDIYQFPALVVVDDRMKPLAVVTEGDICRAVSHRDSLIGMAEDSAFRFGSQDPVVASPEIEIGEAFHRMLGSGLTILPVVDEDRLLGIVLRVDLMQSMLSDAGVANDSNPAP